MSLSRIKTWISEVLTASDLNAEFNNILNFLNGVVSLDGLNVTNTTIPTNGIYLPAASSPAISVNGAHAARFTTGGLLVGATSNLSGMDTSGGQILAARGFYTTSNNGLFWSIGTNINGVPGVSVNVIAGNSGGVSLLAGATAWSITSDYRAKNVFGEFTSSGAMIDAVPVHLAQMKDGVQHIRPMFLAHQVAEGGAGFAVHGEKDAVDEKGASVMQQLASTDPLVPVLWAEVQSLRKRIAAAGF